MSECPSSNFTYNIATAPLSPSLGDGVFTVMTWFILQSEEEAHARDLEGFSLPVGTFSRISEEGLVRGALLWIQMHLWLALDP